jgi:hypothetical protein
VIPLLRAASFKEVVGCVSGTAHAGTNEGVPHKRSSPDAKPLRFCGSQSSYRSKTTGDRSKTTGRGFLPGEVKVSVTQTPQPLYADRGLHSERREHPLEDTVVIRVDETVHVTHFIAILSFPQSFSAHD